MQEENQISNIEKIYVKLLDEDIDVYRPVNALKIDNDIYKILDDNIQAYEEYLEEWEFGKDDIVKCIYRELSEGKKKKKSTLVAVEKLLSYPT